MSTSLNAHPRADRDTSFVIGLFTGALVGAGLAMWLAPRSASELRERFTTTARRVGERASEHYREASTRFSEAADELARHGACLRDDVVRTNPAAGEPAPKIHSL